MSLYINQSEKTIADISIPEISATIVSIIVPVTERCDDLSEIYQSHSKVMRQIGRSFEFIFVIDDGFAEAAQKLEQNISFFNSHLLNKSQPKKGKKLLYF